MAWTGSGWYADTTRKALVLDVALDLELDSHKLALYTNSLTPDFSATDPAYSSSNEVSGTNYTAGGKVVTGTALTVSTGILVWDGDNVQWDDSTLTGVRGGIIYADALGTNDLIIGINFGADYATAAGSLLVGWAGTGIGRIDMVP